MAEEKNNIAARRGKRRKAGQDQDPGEPAGPGPARHRGLSLHDRAAVRRPRQIQEGRRRRPEHRPPDPAADPERHERGRPGQDQLYHFGTVALIVRMLKLPDGRMRVLVQGISRVKRAQASTTTARSCRPRSTPLEDEEPAELTLENKAMIKNVRQKFEQAGKLGKPISNEILVIAENIEEPGQAGRYHRLQPGTENRGFAAHPGRSKLAEAAGQGPRIPEL